MKTNGIDISKWQGNIDFNAVKKDGVKFVIIRAGSGTKTDPYFERNYIMAKLAGLHVGVYWYSYAKSLYDAKMEAQAIENLLKDKQLDYPVYYDVEEKSQFAKGKKFVNGIIFEFCDYLEKRGYYVGVYMSKSYAQNYLTADTVSRFDLWIAQYNSKCTYTGKYNMWQKSSTGKVNGINGNVDMNECYIDYASIMRKVGLNGYVKK